MDDQLRLTAVSPIDGRYQKKSESLSVFFSESALIKYRVLVEIEYLTFFMTFVLKRPIDQKLQRVFDAIKNQFDLAEAAKVTGIEAVTHHDVKAVEYYLREKLVDYPDLHPYIHLGLTSEDINSCAYSLMIKDALDQVMLPAIDSLITIMSSKAQEYKAVPMLARTHGQAAIPTTMGKELLNFVMRLHHEREYLGRLPVEAKVNGAVGNFNALQCSYPKVDWVTMTDQLVTHLGLTPNHFTTQILPTDSYLKIFQSFALINSILIGFDQDLWRYISDGYFSLKVVKTEVGSSTMPHKVNPIDFENSEGNLGLANALFTHFVGVLPISRLQRDLVGSTTRRNFGSAFAYSLIGYTSCLAGLTKISLEPHVLMDELSEHWEIVTEGIQTILRASGEDQAYEMMKELSRGKVVTQTTIKDFIASLSVSELVKKQLLALSPTTYVGLAESLVEKGMHETHS